MNPQKQIEQFLSPEAHGKTEKAIVADALEGVAAMIQAHQNFVSESAKAAKTLLDLYGSLVQLNVLWAGSPNYDALITQGEIDGVESFAGLTAAELGDAEFAMASIKDIITNALPALAVVGNLP